MIDYYTANDDNHMSLATGHVLFGKYWNLEELKVLNEASLAVDEAVEKYNTALIAKRKLQCDTRNDDKDCDLYEKVVQSLVKTDLTLEDAASEL